MNTTAAAAQTFKPQSDVDPALLKRYVDSLRAMTAVELLDELDTATRQLVRADLGSDLWASSADMKNLVRSELLERLSD
jgi:hypothetical protein